MPDMVFRHIKGIKKVISGYAYGDRKSKIVSRLDLEDKPLTYEPKKHVEVVQIHYNSDQVDYETIMEIFLLVRDHSLEAAKMGRLLTQYRSIVFYQTESEKT